MSCARTWPQLEALLPAGWSEARVSIHLDDPSQRVRGAAILGPLNPGSTGDAYVFDLVAAGGTNGSEAVKRTIGKLQEERISFALEVVGTKQAATPATATAAGGGGAGSLAAGWDAALGTLPSDWSDIYGEVTLESSDLLDPAALLLGPINPYRNKEANAFRFRAARLQGYGASAGMVRRCLERVDERGIGGTVTILRALCETRPVATQGPQWVEQGWHF